MTERRSARLQFLLGDRGAVIGVVIVGAIVIAAIFAPFVAPYDPFDQNAAIRLSAPSWEHWLGTDQFGRDVLSRLIWGTRISLYVGIAAVIIGGLIGTAIGLAAGYFRGWFDNVVGWFTGCDDVLSDGSPGNHRDRRAWRIVHIRGDRDRCRVHFQVCPAYPRGNPGRNQSCLCRGRPGHRPKPSS